MLEMEICKREMKAVKAEITLEVRIGLLKLK